MQLGASNISFWYYYGSRGLTRIAEVLLLRAGYILIQLGSVPVENIYTIIIQNIVDIAIAIASFGSFGFGLAFGRDADFGFIGHGKWFLSGFPNLDHAIIGMSACLIGTGIITTILCGRVHFLAYILISLTYSMLCLPVVMHWVWHPDGWMHKNLLLNRIVSLKDYSGCSVVHVTAGVVACVGTLFLGRRLIRLKEIDESSIGVESSGSTVTGYILIILGLTAFSLPLPSYEATHIPANYTGAILINNILALAAGVLTVVLLQFLCYREPFHYWIILRCLQGAISGMVTISGGIDIYIPLVAYGCASLGALVFYMTAIGIHNSSIEDYCNIIAIHTVCGFLGTLLPPLVASAENLGSSISVNTFLIHFLWQAICLVVITCWAIIFFVVIFSILSLTNVMRNENERINHQRSLIASSKGKHCFLQRLFRIHQTTPYLEPGIFGKTINEIELKNSEEKEIEIQSDDKIASKQRCDKKIRTRCVHTVSNLQQPKLEECVIGDGLGSSSNELKFDLKQGMELVKVPSYYDLHRTKKWTSLVFGRKKSNAPNSDVVDVKTSFDLLCNAKVCSNKIVTIKMPPDDYLSDDSLEASSSILTMK